VKILPCHVAGFINAAVPTTSSTLIVDMFILYGSL
jgi:hypothetical protein